jgi:hypothetical protein
MDRIKVIGNGDFHNTTQNLVEEDNFFLHK